jgi:hypothetical protein
MTKPASAYRLRHANRLCSLLTCNACRDLLPKSPLDLAPMRRRTWRAHRCSPCQLIHPPRWSSHKHLLDQRCCDDRLNPPMLPRSEWGGQLFRIRIRTLTAQANCEVSAMLGVFIRSTSQAHAVVRSISDTSSHIRRLCIATGGRKPGGGPAARSRRPRRQTRTVQKEESRLERNGRPG